MKYPCYLLLFCLLSLSFTACSRNAHVDETKPISEIREESAGMSVNSLMDRAVAYKDAINKKSKQIEVLQDKIGSFSPIDLIGDKAQDIKEFKVDLDNLVGSLSALKARLDVYIELIKQKGGDINSLIL